MVRQMQTATFRSRGASEKKAILGLMAIFFLPDMAILERIHKSAARQIARSRDQRGQEPVICKQNTERKEITWTTDRKVFSRSSPRGQGPGVRVRVCVFACVRTCAHTRALMFFAQVRVLSLKDKKRGRQVVWSVPLLRPVVWLKES